MSVADGVEAVTRSVRTITAEKLGALIDRMIADRVADGQLDEAPLTFEDLAKITEQLHVHAPEHAALPGRLHVCRGPPNEAKA